MLVSQLRKAHPVATTYATALRRTSNLGKAKAIHAKLVKLLTDESDYVFIHNHLVNAYVNCGEMYDARQVFGEMPVKNVVSWTVLIGGLVQKGFLNEAVLMFSDLHRSGDRPNEYTFVSVLQACSFAEGLDVICTLEVYAMVIKFGFGNNAYLVNAFLTALIRHGMLEAAMQVFEGFVDKDIVSWNAMFDGLLKFSCQDVPRLWYRMVFEGIKPDEFTFATVLTGLAKLSDLEMGLRVHSILVKSGYGCERGVGNTLVDMYLKNECIGDGVRAFEEIPSKNVRSWTQMIIGCVNCGEPVEALRLIGDMRRAGMQLNMYNLATGLNACANMASLTEGQKVHGLMIKFGGNIDVCAHNALLDMYAKCGSMDEASAVFWSMTERSVVSWTAMIMGYAQNGHPEKALEIFERMKAETKPNYITFTCVLHACSQGGYVEAGLECFSSMRNVYGIVPREDHYTCMVNLLGKAGQFKEAEELILGMPFRPGAGIWQTLLSACRLHGDLDAAKRAAQRALAVDGNDASTYVLLSNTFADFADWRGAGRLRKRVQNRDIKKIPGSSWVQVNNDR